MAIWTNKILSEALGVAIRENFTHGGIVQFNSKDVMPGDVFVALKTGGDGHDYVSDAIARGASVAIVERAIEGVPAGKMIVVKDCFAALKAMAAYKRTNSKAIFIALTGSAGKTSTKDALAFTLSNFAESFGSRGSFNNELGIALNVASMPDDIKYAVFEVGMNNPGEIRAIIPMIKPHLVLINNILPAHIGNFKSLDAIADAKLEILEGIDPDGIAVFNADSTYYEYCCKKAKELGIEKIFSFGEKKTANGVLMSYQFDGTLGANVVNLNGKEIHFQTKIAGHHRILNLVVVLLICDILGFDAEKAAKSLIDIEEPRGRGQVSDAKYNNIEITIVDDAYNASPPAMKESLKHFGDMKHKYKVAILGDMRELGQKEIEYHRELLPYVIKSGVSKLHTVGVLMNELHKILPEDIRGRHFADYTELKASLGDIIDRKMMILLKASKSMKFWSVIIDELLKNKDK